MTSAIIVLILLVVVGIALLVGSIFDARAWWARRQERKWFDLSHPKGPHTPGVKRSLLAKVLIGFFHVVGLGVVLIITGVITGVIS